MGADTKANTLWGGGAPERGHSTPLERLAQLGDALGGVGAAAVIVDAAQLVIAQAATREEGVSTGADTSDSSGGCDALKRGHGAPLEPLAELGDALSGVGATAEQVEAAELVVGQSTMGGASRVRK